jgi:hypothetical protein
VEGRGSDAHPFLPVAAPPYAVMQNAAKDLSRVKPRRKIQVQAESVATAEFATLQPTAIAYKPRPWVHDAGMKLISRCASLEVEAFINAERAKPSSASEDRRQFRQRSTLLSRSGAVAAFKSLQF